MKGNKKLIYAALFAALCCVITMYPKFPTLFGYIHAGDALVLLGAYVLGPLWGALAAALAGVQFFLAGFLGELIGRNSGDRNRYLIDERI